MDYYQTLGVPRNASDKELRSAYKKLSMQHHPDRGGDESKFKEVNEAYSTLKDPNKRAEYDNPQPQFAQGFGPNGFQGMGGFEDLFSQAFSRGARRQARNKDVRVSYVLDFNDVYTGKAVSISFNLPSGRREHLDVSIPPGFRNGDQVNFAGYGDDSIRHLPRGNLILTIKVPAHPIWKRDGNNLNATKHLSVFDLILGTNIDIKTPDGKNISLTVPKGTKSGTTFSITGYGMPEVNTGRLGNIYVKIEGVVPKIDDTRILEKIKNIRDEIT